MGTRVEVALTTQSQPAIPIADSGDGIDRISAQTLHDLLHGKYDKSFHNLYIVDCRYAYEYDYGHIRGAIHAPTPATVRDFFFPEVEARALIIFHCELSRDRGPRLAAVLREVDRQINKNRYPALFYPDILILDGDYRQFHSAFPSDCEGGYRQMRDEAFVEAGHCARATSEYREAFDEYERGWKYHPLQEIAALYLGTNSPAPHARRRVASLPDVFRALCFGDDE
jgi:rhodanese-related sulfurtransferase